LPSWLWPPTRDIVARYDPYSDQDYDNIQAPPSREHFFGTDNLGRDNWSRVLTGIEISLQIGLGTQVLVLIFGLAVGVSAGLGGRWSDNILMRLTDITYAFRLAASSY
jgi:ABC-type dipeptide/oligopeptide/nickel transport system permease subunit